MSFNKRKMEDQRREAAEKEAVNRRATVAGPVWDSQSLSASLRCTGAGFGSSLGLAKARHSLSRFQ
jgi:hypothetical protein